MHGLAHDVNVPAAKAGWQLHSGEDGLRPFAASAGSV
jgi:hypothetical protein